MSRAMVAVLLVVVVLGVAIGVAWGARALVVYAFFAGIPTLIGIGLSVGGGWFRDASSGRFRRGRG
ncbi:MAG: hypothetical protein ICV67_06055 [Thermoleophilia bacterium]|nr:hypothetical protein [Thermoleophilia bacterium]